MTMVSRDDVEAADVGIPGFAWEGLMRNETDSIESCEKAGETLHHTAEGEVRGEEVGISRAGAH